jgi:hypothetical protein
MRPVDKPGKNDVPFEPPYASLKPPMPFWQDMFTLLFFGAFMGVFGVGYIKIIKNFPLLWTQVGNSNFPWGGCSYWSCCGHCKAHP